MAQTGEQSDSADSMPRPELNPLVNPLLADNMGRWAEVYFTSPADKREEAVLELLRQLEREQGRVPDPAPLPPPQPAFVADPASSTKAKVDDPPQDLAPCLTCGHENPVSHQFCGMCGSRLADDLERHEPPPREVQPQDFRDTDFRDAREQNIPQTREDFFAHAERQDSARFTPNEPHTPTPAPSFAAGNNDLSLFQSFRPRDPDREWDYEHPHSSPYRFYLGAVLAIVILVLGYMAWRGTQAAQSSHEASAPPPVAATEPAPAAPAPPTSAAKNSEPTAPAKTAPQTTPRSTANANGETQTARREIARRTPAPAPENTQLEPASSTNGAEELGVAERYLNGTGGQGRDSSEAAKWLWKSIAKHNGPASILLADLYLKGDGVSKNCDQGRVLLDSAARRGIPGAGERLRNLQAFGCH